MQPEFADALKKGTGRAVLLLRANPDNQALHEALLAGCRQHQGYDRQAEDSRASWLRDMIRHTRRADYFYEALVAHLQSFDAGSDSYDIAQNYELLCLVAADDPRRDRQALETFLSSPVLTEDGLWDDCARGFIRLSGLRGFLQCIGLFAPQLREDFADWGGARFHDWVEALATQDRQALESLRSERPLLDEFMALDAAREEPPPRSPESYEYAALKAGLGRRSLFPHRWMREAHQAEIDAAAADLLEARDDKIIRAYLMIFARRDFPLAPSLLFRFLDGDGPCADLAAQALGRLKDERIRALALEALAAGRVKRALQLLPANFAPGDFGSIDAALSKLEDDDDLWHGVVWALRHLLDNAEVDLKKSRNALIAAYEKGPCPLCRTLVVSKLQQAGKAPDWMERECAFDCDAKTRALFGG